VAHERKTVNIRRNLTNAELWQSMIEAEQRKGDNALPIDVRVKWFQTYTMCLREAHRRGLDYAALREDVARNA
jgi:hypothetical protein